MTKNQMVCKPIKFRIIELLMDDGELWNYEIIDTVTKENNQTSTFQRNDLNFDCIEVAASGFIEAIDSAVDEDGSKLGKDRLLTKYKITDLGKAEYKWLAANAKGAKKET